MSLVARITSLAQRDSMSAIGLGLSAAWLALVLIFWLVTPTAQTEIGGIGRLVAVVGILLPLVLIWTAVALARSIATLRAEAEDMRRSLTLLREFAATRGAPPPAHPEGPARTAPASRTLEGRASATSSPVSPAAATTRMRPVEPRPTSPAADADEKVTVAPETLIRALNFPDGPDDADAISALRSALKDQSNSRVLRASQDVITLLASHDVYMDDLSPVHAPAEVWRDLAQGARGETVSALGAIREEATEDVVASMLQQDEIFRDAAHHFLRHFDALLSRLIPQLDDDRIATLSQTRSARAFMLLGRVTGIFG